MATKTVIAKIGGKGRLTLPREVREAARISEGDVLEIQVVDDHTLVVRAKFMVDRDQAWVWTSSWLEKLRHAGDDVEAGRTERYDTDEAFLAAFDE
jgi:AbrB family looped-hinge helix DNA binding protein